MTTSRQSANLSHATTHPIIYVKSHSSHGYGLANYGNWCINMVRRIHLAILSPIHCNLSRCALNMTEDSSWSKEALVGEAVSGSCCSLLCGALRPTATGSEVILCIVRCMVMHPARRRIPAWWVESCSDNINAQELTALLLGLYALTYCCHSALLHGTMCEGNPVPPKEMERGVVSNTSHEVSRHFGASISMNIINPDTRLGFPFVNSVTACPSKCRQHGRDDCRGPLMCCFRCRHNRLHLHIVNEYPALTVHAKVFESYRTAAVPAGVVCSSEKCLEVEAQFRLKLIG